MQLNILILGVVLTAALILIQPRLAVAKICRDTVTPLDADANTYASFVSFIGRRAGFVTSTNTWLDGASWTPSTRSSGDLLAWQPVARASAQETAKTRRSISEAPIVRFSCQASK